MCSCDFTSQILVVANNMLDSCEDCWQQARAASARDQAADQPSKNYPRLAAAGRDPKHKPYITESGPRRRGHQRLTSYCRYSTILSSPFVLFNDHTALRLHWLSCSVISFASGHYRTIDLRQTLVLTTSVPPGYKHL
jgi:hypothetical protein